MPIMPKVNVEDIVCPVCGYNCLGNGGWGCIDKPKLLSPVKTIQTEIVRCGECGRFFRADGQQITVNDIKKLNGGDCNLDYCPDCANEAQENQDRTVTKDMAIDAGMPELEGMRL